MKYIIYTSITLTICTLLTSCNRKRDIYISTNVECFDDLETFILNTKNTIEKSKDTLILDFTNQINCFKWDSLSIEKLNNYSIRQYVDYRFKVINDNVYERLKYNGNVEADNESWNYIFFYKNSERLKDVIAFANSDLYPNSKTFSSINLDSIHQKSLYYIIKKVDSSSLDSNNYFKYLELTKIGNGSK